MMADTNTYQAQANELSQKLWAIANELRGQMDASEFKNYILGVIFYRYLSERTEMYMAEILENDGVTYEEAFADDDYRPVVEEWSLSKLGYVIKPENLFHNLIRKITKFENDADKFSVEDFEKAINELVGSTMGHESNKVFDGLFNDMRLQDARLGETVADRTDMIGRVMVKVSDIDFDLQDSQFDVLGTAYMILMPERKAESSSHLPDRADFVRHLHPLDWTKQRPLVTVPAVLHPCCWKFRSI